MAKPDTEEVDPRLLAKGTVIWHKGNKAEEVVRSVSVILHLANGESQTFSVGKDTVEVLTVQPDPVEKAKLIVAKDTPSEAADKLREEIRKRVEAQLLKEREK